MTDSAATIPPAEAAGEEDLGDLLLEVLPGDGGSLGNLSAREALAKAAGVEVSEEAYEAVKERLLAMGLIPMVRALIEDHVRAAGIDPRVPPISLFSVEFKQHLASLTRVGAGAATPPLPRWDGAGAH